ncbi:hypothetical protein [Paraburkholderia youngii]|uniref:hypothetical protein n=1 Tax=Paraburkholderia youngii TaxID=2782701 RepID=UPI003D1C671B
MQPIRPISEQAKQLLIDTMTAQGVRPVDLAARLGMSRQAVNRLIDLSHPTKIDAISDALAVLGKRLRIDIIDI